LIFPRTPEVAEGSPKPETGNRVSHALPARTEAPPPRFQRRAHSERILAGRQAGKETGRQEAKKERDGAQFTVITTDQVCGLISEARHDPEAHKLGEHLRSESRTDQTRSDTHLVFKVLLALRPEEEEAAAAVHL
jgi:hypothetical protein